MITPYESKAIGWDKPAYLRWPESLNEVAHADRLQLLMWCRFLPTTETDHQRHMIDAIVGHLKATYPVVCDLPPERNGT